jgi:Tfp pilus assembly protein PilO
MSLTTADLTALAKRYPYCVACAILTLVLGGVAYFLWDQIDALEAQHQDRSKEGEAMLTQLVGGSTQRTELADVRDAAHRIEANLAVESELPENNRYFYKFEEQTKSHLLELHQLNSPALDSNPLYKRIPYTARVSGTYEQVAAFLLALETGPRLVNITSFSLARASGAGPRGGSGRDPAPTEAGASGVVLDLTLELLGKK